jgi:hypothetical protein
MGVTLMNLTGEDTVVAVARGAEAEDEDDIVVESADTAAVIDPAEEVIVSEEQP